MPELERGKAEAAEKNLQLKLQLIESQAQDYRELFTERVSSKWASEEIENRIKLFRKPTQKDRESELEKEREKAKKKIDLKTKLIKRAASNASGALIQRIAFFKNLLYSMP